MAKLLFKLTNKTSVLSNKIILQGFSNENYMLKITL